MFRVVSAWKYFTSCLDGLMTAWISSTRSVPTFHHNKPNIPWLMAAQDGCLADNDQYFNQVILLHLPFRENKQAEKIKSNKMKLKDEGRMNEGRMKEEE